MKLSIIIVNYKVKKQLFECLESIYSSKPNTNFEIIVVDNDEIKIIERKLINKFPKVKYLKSNRNLGFGGGNNLGVGIARGKYLFFLNPDTLVFPGVIDKLYEYINVKMKIGAVSPLLVTKNLNSANIIGSAHHTILNAIFSLTFFHKIFPNNFVSNKFFLKDWDRKRTKQVDVVPGTAFMISKKLFQSISGFDKNFFLFFEEADLCKKINKLGYKNYIIPEARIVHLGGSSTKKRNDIDKIFAKSRFYYFKKWHGLMSALLLELFFKLKKEHILIGIISISSLFLGFYKLNETMVFIGDQGWFYISARDFILSGEIPLVGIASSHVWLHQGAFWTYILIPLLWLFNFNPVSGAIFTVILGMLTVVLIYKVGSIMFSKKTGLISAFFYATSPLFIEHSRFAYHTSPIPFFTILLLGAVYMFIKGNQLYFPIVIFLLSVLYNFEIATFSFAISFVLILGYGLLTKQRWMMKMFNKKILTLTLVAFIVPMLPMIIYDFQNGFLQTLKFLAWGVYKILGFIGLISYESGGNTWASFISFNANLIRNTFFPLNFIISIIIFVSILAVLVYTFLKESQKKLEKLLLLFLFMIPLLGYILLKTNSDAYTLIFYPTVALMYGIAISYLLKFKNLKTLTYLSIILIGIINIFYFIWKLNINESYYLKKVAISREIITSADRRQYNIIGRGGGSQFSSFTSPYEYLTWWMGHGPSDKEEKLKFFISEDSGKTILEKEISE